MKEGIHQDGEIGEVGKFISDYKIYRKDRNDGYGGVFIAVTQDLISARVGVLETDTELLWVRINIEGSKTLYIGGNYRVNEYDEASMDQFTISMSRIP